MLATPSRPASCCWAHDGLPIERCLVQGVCVAAVSLLSLSTSAGILPLADCLAYGERKGSASA